MRKNLLPLLNVIVFVGFFPALAISGGMGGLNKTEAGEMEKGTVEHVPSSEYGMGGFRTSENCSGCYGEMLPGRGKGSRTKHSQEISVPGKKALHVKEDRHSSTGSLD